MKLTVKTTAALQLPAGTKDYIAWDDATPGLGLRLREGGSRGWVFQCSLGVKQRRMTLGSATAVSLVKAREIASELHAKVRLGQDPAGQKAESRQRAAETFEAVAQRFLAYQRGQLRPGSYRQVERHILAYAKPLHRLQLATIDRRTIAGVVNAIKDRGAAVTANRARSTLSHFFSWSMNEGFIGNNPIIGMNTFDEAPRERVLSDAELKLIWNAVGDDHFGAIIKLLALLGQRADEMASLQWSEISDDTITLPSSRTKKKREHVIPLSGPALAILEAQPRRANGDGVPRDYVFGVGERGFSGWSRCKQRLDERIAKENGSPLPSWRIHDLRRSVASGMARLGVDLPTIEKVLNHTSGSFAGIVSVYQRHDFMPEKRRALALWAEHLLGVVEGRESNVTPMRRPA